MDPDEIKKYFSNAVASRKKRYGEYEWGEIDFGWREQEFDSLRDEMEKVKVELMQKAKASISASTARQAQVEPKRPDPKFVVVKTFDMPSGKVHNISIKNPEIGAYIFSEYTHGTDWYESAGNVIVKDHVLFDLQMRYAV